MENRNPRTRIKESKSPHRIDDRVRGVLNTVKWATDNLGIKPGDEEGGRNTPKDCTLVRKSAADSIVLLKHDKNILRWKKSAVKKLAIIGPNAKVAKSHGGGSGAVRLYYKISPYDGLANAVKNVEITYPSDIAATCKATSNTTPYTYLQIA